VKIKDNIFKTDKNLNILGVKFNACQPSEMVKLIYDLNVENASAHISFIGVPIINLCQKEMAYKELYNQTTITSIDGQPVANLAKQCGFDCDRCSGPDIMNKILTQGIQDEKKHFFYGTTQETLEKLVTNLQKQFIGIDIVGSYAPPFRVMTEEEDDEIVNIINNSGADYVWVGLGAPKQDLWINDHIDKIKNVKFMAVGAAFDFYAGTLKRAPVWMRKIGLEWLYRFVKEPRRLWNRYIVGAFQWRRNKKAFKKQLKKEGNETLC